MTSVNSKIFLFIFGSDDLFIDNKGYICFLRCSSASFMNFGALVLNEYIFTIVISSWCFFIPLWWVCSFLPNLFWLVLHWSFLVRYLNCYARLFLGSVCLEYFFPILVPWCNIFAWWWGLFLDTLQRWILISKIICLLLVIQAIIIDDIS